MTEKDSSFKYPLELPGFGDTSKSPLVADGSIRLTFTVVLYRKLMKGLSSLAITTVGFLVVSAMFFGFMGTLNWIGDRLWPREPLPPVSQIAASPTPLPYRQAALAFVDYGAEYSFLFQDPRVSVTCVTSDKLIPKAKC